MGGGEGQPPLTSDTLQAGLQGGASPEQALLVARPPGQGRGSPPGASARIPGRHGHWALGRWCPQLSDPTGASERGTLRRSQSLK